MHKAAIVFPTTRGEHDMEFGHVVEASTMKLFHNIASPFVRKVRVLAAETGQSARIELVQSVFTPVQPDREVFASNPLGKIPTLLLDDGTALYDSRVICEYLDTLHDGPRLFPAAGPARWSALTRQAQGDGILDAAVGTRYELALRDPSRQWPEWIENQRQKYRRSLDALEAEAASLDGAIDIGVITAACALGYLDFRYPDEGWRDIRPGLAEWYTSFRERDSMRTTAPE